MPKIAVLPGDGIGTEIMTEAVKVLKKIGEKYQTEFELEEGYIGGILQHSRLLCPWILQARQLEWTVIP